MHNCLEIKYDVMAGNAAKIKDYTGKELLVVVKNNAYNMGLLEVVGCLMQVGVRHFCVAAVDEAETIKRNFPEAYVLATNPANAEEIQSAQKLYIALSIPGKGWLEANRKRLQGVELHLKFNVGMNRFGARGVDEAREILGICSAERLEVTGLSTHFPLAEEDDLTEHNRQVDVFAGLYRSLSDAAPFRYIHSENSATLVQRDPRLDFCNYVRPGILVYGYSASSPVDWVNPVLFLHSRVIYIQSLDVGDHLGYGTSFTATEKMRVAVLALGYGDGLLRVRKEAPVYINGRAFPIVSKIFMSHLFIAVDESIQVGDWVEIYGEHIRPDTLSAAGYAANSEQLSALHTYKR